MIKWKMKDFLGEEYNGLNYVHIQAKTAIATDGHRLMAWTESLPDGSYLVHKEELVEVKGTDFLNNKREQVHKLYSGIINRKGIEHTIKVHHLASAIKPRYKRPVRFYFDLSEEVASTNLKQVGEEGHTLCVNAYYLRELSDQEIVVSLETKTEGEAIKTDTLSPMLFQIAVDTNMVVMPMRL